MQIRKYALLLAFISLFSHLGFSQGDAMPTWKDTSKVSTKSQAQQNDFLNHTYPYPPKPRNQWELGFAVGNSIILGDIKSKADVGGAITLRKALSTTFSLRGIYFGGYQQGYPSGYGTLIGQKSYQNWTHSLGMDLIASLNPISIYRGNPKTNIYILGGVNLVAAKVFEYVGGGRAQQIDNNYRTFYGYGVANSLSGLFPGAETIIGKKVNNRKGWSLLPALSFGAGMSVKLNKKVNIGIEQRFMGGNYDLLDARRGGASSSDVYSFTSARLNLNIGSSSSRVEPLWWINPNNYVYNELNRPTHMILPAPVLPDADNDGVTDQFDMEPNTPSGSPVDVRGVAKDTDGDGVPDYKDKELLTPSKCFPVNADGVGNCPEAACCTELRNKLDSLHHNGGGDNGGGDNGGNCGLNNLPSIQFKSGSSKLSTSAMNMLAAAAAQIKSQPDCRVKVVGHGTSDKRAQQMSWDRVKAVIRYFVEKQGLSQDRFIFTYGEEGDNNTVDLVGTKETGPNTVPAPHPNLRNNR